MNSQEYLAIFLSLLIMGGLIRILSTMLFKQYWFGVPFIRSKQEGIKALLDNLSLKPGEVFLDLGCGDGIVMASVLEKYPEVVARGYELLPKAYNLSSDYQTLFGKHFTIYHTDFFKADFSDASVIYCYLLPRLITPVRAKIQKECKLGTIFYSYVFELKGIEADEKIVVPISGRKDDILYKYITS